MREPWLSDPDVTLYHGDVLATLREMPAESVDCVVTSPPYWGLRDYGTGAWEVGDSECDHKRKNARNDPDRNTRHTDGRNPETQGLVGVQDAIQYSEVCGKCGATRIDQQLGLEPTPEQYVERMVEVFREVRRVLAAHGTVWLNLGDSYAGGGAAGTRPDPNAGSAALIGAPNPVPPGLKQKDLCGIPWRVAFALQADGWYLRSDVIWAKPNPMPESVTDRPTKAHEYIFLLSKQPRYFFDQEAVREPHVYGMNGGAFSIKYREAQLEAQDGSRNVERTMNPAGRNIRSVWEIATQPYPEAHFATFPEELARRCIAAGCPEQVCRVCGKARERLVEREQFGKAFSATKYDETAQAGPLSRSRQAYRAAGLEGPPPPTTIGFTDCGHADYRPGIVLDPFMGSGTVAYVARKLGRQAVGIDLSAEYLTLAARRLQQQSLFAVAT